MYSSVYRPPTVAILYPGELGSALATCFSEQGMRVITALAGRSARTRRNCRRAKIEELKSVQAVAELADVVFSLVTPGSALEFARNYFQSVAPLPGSIYVDMNSVGPAATHQIESLAKAAGVGFVDAKVHGLACHLREDARVYLSGTDADRIAALFPAHVSVECLEGAAGAAASLKMLIGGLNKGLITLFLQLSLAALRAGCLDEFLQRTNHFYPGIQEIVERLLPTLRQHSERRAGEMNELSQMLVDLGVSNGFPEAAQQVFADLALKEPLPASVGSASPRATSIVDVVRRLSSPDPLSPPGRLSIPDRLSPPEPSTRLTRATVGDVTPDSTARQLPIHPHAS